MNAHRAAPDSAAALIEQAVRALGRVGRVAPFAPPTPRLRLRGEISLLEQALDEVEASVAAEAQAMLNAVQPQRALPRGRRAPPPAPAFKGGRGLRELPAPHRAPKRKRLTAGSRA